ncbi:hypothetical protein [Oscillibacter sp. PC13]|nr:hypothetical protein [Oscillibacter sp. PC13]
MNGWTLKESLAVGLSFFAAVLATIAAARRLPCGRTLQFPPF